MPLLAGDVTDVVEGYYLIVDLGQVLHVQDDIVVERSGPAQQGGIVEIALAGHRLVQPADGEETLIVAFEAGEDGVLGVYRYDVRAERVEGIVEEWGRVVVVLQSDQVDRVEQHFEPRRVDVPQQTRDLLHGVEGAKLVGMGGDVHAGGCCVGSHVADGCHHAVPYSGGARVFAGCAVEREQHRETEADAGCPQAAGVGEVATVGVERGAVFSRVLRGESTMEAAQLADGQPVVVEKLPQPRTS